jgi:hypothetical protein
MNCHSTIRVYELFGSSIHTREVSSVLTRRVQNDPCDHIELDFSSVDYISRSFADQFLFDQIKLTNELQKTIIVANASEAVTKMLQIVAKSPNNNNRETEKVPVYKYSSQHQLENFLLGF